MRFDMETEKIMVPLLPDPTNVSWQDGRLNRVEILKLQPAEAEIWATNQWTQKSGYNPYGIGVNGWGTIQGYTKDEVAAIPAFTSEQLKGYFDEVIKAVSARLDRLEDSELEAPAPGYEGKRTIYFWLRLSILDLTRHLGEILALLEMWKRQNVASKEIS